MANNHNQHEHHGHHLVPLSVYFKTIIALLALTVLTVGASYVDVGKANIFVSMGIAVAKAALVMMFFMGLKYDNNLNRAYILSSFVGFALMIGISASDLWTRAKPQPVAVKSEETAPGVEELTRLLSASSPELVAHGKELFAVNCAVCHGTEGKGDGAAGAALDPKPRNFHMGGSEWKNGASAKSIFVTLMYGIPGSGMSSYKALPTKDRIALIHFLHTWTPDQVGKADDRFAAALKEDGVGEGGAGPSAKLPVDFAIDRIIQN